MDILIQTAKNFFFLIVIVLVFCFFKVWYDWIQILIDKFKKWKTKNTYR